MKRSKGQQERKGHWHFLLKKSPHFVMRVTLRKMFQVFFTGCFLGTIYGNRFVLSKAHNIIANPLKDWCLVYLYTLSWTKIYTLLLKINLLFISFVEWLKWFAIVCKHILEMAWIKSMWCRSPRNSLAALTVSSLVTQGHHFIAFIERKRDREKRSLSTDSLPKMAAVDRSFQQPPPGLLRGCRGSINWNVLCCFPRP